jgi:hypothetical protein
LTVGLLLALLALLALFALLALLALFALLSFSQSDFRGDLRCLRPR